MNNDKYYSKRVVYSFFIGVFLAGPILYTINYFWHRNPLINDQEKAFIEVGTETKEESNSTEQTALLIHSTKNIPQSDPKDAVYIQVTDGCGAHFNETPCLNVRNKPDINSPVVAQLRNGLVLKVEKIIEAENGKWYKIEFDEWLRYPERLNGDWYISASHVREFNNTGLKEIIPNNNSTSTKKIVIDLSEQLLTAYQEQTIFLESPISTGLDLSPTPRGTFTVFKKTPTRYMQGPITNIPGSDYYDLPGVPWNLYFTEQGAVIHGAYWHNSFGKKYSHGCVNIPIETAERLYHWAELGTIVVVKD